MRNIQWMSSMLLVGTLCAGGAWAADAAPAAEAAIPEARATVLSDADGRALLKKNNCLICHAIDKKSVGPAYKDVAAKYRGQANAEAKLITKVSKGGSGSWGSMPMPPQPAKADDVKAMVRFILSLK